MEVQSQSQRRMLEAFLIVLVLGMAGLYGQMRGHGLVALHLFFLPVILSGYYLGRTSAGVLALLCVLSVTIVTGLVSTAFVAYNSPLVIGLALTLWAAILGMVALLMGTLCDERARTVSELQKAYVGVVEVLAKYLQGANPHVKARSTRVAELSQHIAQELRLPRKEIDNIRVAALLHDLENVEITTQVMSRAVSAVDSRNSAQHTFLGTDLVHSLGNVLEGALPLLVGQDEALRDCLAASNDDLHAGLPIGAQVIAAARAFDDLVSGRGGAAPLSSEAALREMRREAGRHRDDVMAALARVAQRASGAPAAAPPEPVLA